MIAVVDAGLGNLRSVVRALEATGTREPVRLADSAEVIDSASRVVVPGQGAFGECARALRATAPLGSAIVRAIEAGKPYLGICLGLQILFEDSEESPGHPGLGLYRGHVRRLPSEVVDPTGRRLKVPNIGWSPVAVRGAHPVLASMDAGVPWFYFVHSYQAIPVEEELVAAVAAFGDRPLTAAVARDNVVAVQFHPEKSQAAGLRLLSAFVGWRC